MRTFVSKTEFSIASENCHGSLAIVNGLLRGAIFVHF